MNGTVQVVVGGQYGSEGKGNVAAYLGREGSVAAVRVAGPNAGHSAVDAEGRKWALRQIPVMAVKNLTAPLVLGQGSEIDIDVLEDEIERLEAAGIPILDRLYIDPTATVVTEENGLAEGGQGGHLQLRLGSTGKGVGAARADRVWRRAPLVGDKLGYVLQKNLVDTEQLLATLLFTGNDVLIEGTQGYALGQHAGHYPQCTSSDCRAIDFLAMAGITPWARHVREVEAWVVLRTYPIRVAGNSGPLARETSWEVLNRATDGYIQEERTTVTQKVRRVGAWDRDLAQRAVLANGGPECNVALTFFDYWYPELAGCTEPSALEESHWAELEKIEKEIGAKILLVGTGPDSFIDLRVKEGGEG